jgi:hypothetical protein
MSSDAVVHRAGLLAALLHFSLNACSCYSWVNLACLELGPRCYYSIHGSVLFKRGTSCMVFPSEFVLLRQLGNLRIDVSRLLTPNASARAKRISYYCCRVTILL